MSQEFRCFLQGELDRRIKKNAKYSLRSFARFIGISHTSLSCVLRGQRPISPKTITKVAIALGVDPKNLNVTESHSTSVSQSLEKVTVDNYHLIADWYHDAILELVLIKDFKEDPNWIATKLGINRTEAKVALERLFEMNLIERTEDGFKLSSHSTTNVHQPQTTGARKKNQLQILDLSKEAIQNTSFNLRDHSSITMAINSKDIPIAKEMIKNFRRQLMDTLQSNSELDQVYQLHIGFFPLTKVSESNS